MKQESLTAPFDSSTMNFDEFRKQVINDYKIAYESRQASLLGRKEVLTGKAKFGIFGDGKELAQIALAKTFKKGDWRAGYYRDQTFVFAAGMSNITEFFSQLYAHADVQFEPSSAGRQMNCHFSTRFLDDYGQWKKQTDLKLTSTDTSTTGGQMARLVGLAYASKLYRQNPELAALTDFSIAGNEVAFGTVGNASTAEGVFFEAFNAAGVLQIPMVVSVWDDAYGISVHAQHQTTKEDISEVLKGFQREEGKPGFEIFKVRGWDYVALCETYLKAVQIAREEHVPVLVHVTEMTQPQGHSTSGSHERYKSKERLQWEAEYDCIIKMREWIIESAIADETEIISIENQAKTSVREYQKTAWMRYLSEIKSEIQKTVELLEQLTTVSAYCQELSVIINELKITVDPGRKDIATAIRKVLRITRSEQLSQKYPLIIWYKEQQELNKDRYNSKLFTDSSESPSKIEEIKPLFEDNPQMVDGREVLNACFDSHFQRDPRIVALGEDVGQIGDVNQGFAGLQKKYGELRITDTGIREMTIIGQGIGLAMRGLKPIVEIQYLDYVYFTINILCDDLACLSYRTKGGQKAPLIIRTRGHRLEGIWHSGSPIGMLLGCLRGIHLCVPRNMTQAAGMYNTLLRGDEPAFVIECLNGYRIKEKLPINVGDFTIPLGIAEIVRAGSDITVVSYGSTLRIVQQAADELESMGISIEIVDPQTLLPFDIQKIILQSLQKTNRLLIIDEDIPGGASAFIMQQVLEEHGGYYYLDAQPRTLTAQEHRPPYGSDGDYFSKPNIDDIIEVVYDMMHDTNSHKFPKLYQ